MNRWPKVGRFVDRHFSPLRKSRRTTISALVAGLLRCQWIGLSRIARGMVDATTIRHRVKRIGRFFANGGVCHWAVTECLVELLMRTDRQNLVAIDWTDRGEYMLLIATLCWRRRGLPLAWRHVEKWRYEKSQNDEEDKLIGSLASRIGARPWVLVADRGFGRADLFKSLKSRGIDFVIRVKGNVCIEHFSFSGRIENIERKAGKAKRLADVLYHKTKKVQLTVVLTHKEPAPEPWYLATTLDLPPVQIARMYAKRMWIEENIRDCKTNFRLKLLRLGSPERMDRAMILIAIALVLLALTALASEHRGEDLQLSTRKRSEPALSFVSMGLRILEQFPRKLCIDKSLLRSTL